MADSFSLLIFFLMMVYFLNFTSQVSRLLDIFQCVFKGLEKLLTFTWTPLTLIFHVDSRLIFIEKSAVSDLSKQSCSNLLQNDGNHPKD